MGKKLKKVIFGVGAITAAMYGYNKIIEELANRKQILNRYQGDYFKSKYGDMFYRVFGREDNEDILLLVHDVSCYSSGFEWSKTIKRLSEEYKVYVVDLLGCGRSDKPEILYTSYFYVQLLKMFIDQEIGKSVFAVGTGKAGSILTQLKNMDGNIIKKLMVISPEVIKNVSYTNQLDDNWKKKLIECPILGTFIYNISTSKNLIEELFEEKYFCNKNKIRNKFVDAYYESAHLNCASSRFLYLSLKNNYLDSDIKQALNKMDENYAVAIGTCNEDYDLICKQYSVNKNIVMKEIDSAKYLPQLEKPEVITQMITDFMKE